MENKKKVYPSIKFLNSNKNCKRRIKGMSPRQLGTNPRALGTNPRALGTTKGTVSSRGNDD